MQDAHYGVGKINNWQQDEKNVHLTVKWPHIVTIFGIGKYLCHDTAKHYSKNETKDDWKCEKVSWIQDNVA